MGYITFILGPVMLDLSRNGFTVALIRSTVCISPGFVFHFHCGVLLCVTVRKINKLLEGTLYFRVLFLSMVWRL